VSARIAPAKMAESPAPSNINLPKRIPATIVGWMYPFELVWLYRTAIELKGLGVQGGALEVGSYKGLSASALGQAGKLTCVDTFRGGEDLPSRYTRPEFDEAMRIMDLHPRVIEGTSTEVLGDLVQWRERFALVFIDGSHRYEQVKIDLALGWELLNAQGILVADDYIGFPEVREACIETGYGFLPVDEQRSKMAFAQKGET